VIFIKFVIAAEDGHCDCPGHR